MYAKGFNPVARFLFIHFLEWTEQNSPYKSMKNSEAGVAGR
jgi:hypothetical protein